MNFPEYSERKFCDPLPHMEDWQDENENYEQIICEREWEKLKEIYHNNGFRDGISEGRNLNMQEHFNEGAKQGVRVGFAYGHLAGILSSMNLFYSQNNVVSQQLQQEIDQLHCKLVGASSSYSTLTDFERKNNTKNWQEDQTCYYQNVSEFCTQKLQLQTPDNV